MAEPAVDRGAIHREMERARADVQRWLADAAPEGLHRRSDGTRWTNEQLLFHMVFGYLVVRALQPLVHVFGRLPEPASRVFARALDATTKPFHAVNYLGSCAGALVFNHRRMGHRMDTVVAGLHRRLDAEPEAALTRGMHFPPRWDPYFEDWMALADVYHYATLHFDAHARQLTL